MDNRTADNRTAIEDVLLELRARGVRCGLVSLCNGTVGAWLDLDGVIVGGSHFVHDAPLDEIARWLKETADQRERSVSGNVIDASRRFTTRT